MACGVAIALYRDRSLDLDPHAELGREMRYGEDAVDLGSHGDRCQLT